MHITDRAEAAIASFEGAENFTVEDEGDDAAQIRFTGPRAWARQRLHELRAHLEATALEVEFMNFGIENRGFPPGVSTGHRPVTTPRQGLPTGDPYLRVRAKA